jgi:predicted transcriptional regulator
MASALAPRPMATSHPAQRWTIVLDGHRLRHLRIQHHLSQNQLAQLAGISQATVTRLASSA